MKPAICGFGFVDFEKDGLGLDLVGFLKGWLRLCLRGFFKRMASALSSASYYMDTKALYPYLVMTSENVVM